MTESTAMDVLDSRVRRREERRDLFRAFGGKALAVGAAAASASVASAQTVAPSDPDILNFALNLEYLEAQFYSFATTGAGLPNGSLTGTGTQGAVQGGRQVTFQDVTIRQYAREIAADEVAHVQFLRTALGTGVAVAQPALDIRGDNPNSAFSNAARAAGIITGQASFDPYASENNFLLGAFIFEDVGVTAFKGAAPLLSSKVFLEAAAGLLAVEAYHAAIVRTVLYGRGLAIPALRTQADAISNARDSLDGMPDIDQGISPIATPAGAPAARTPIASNIVPLDANGLAFSRTAGQVLNIVYLNRESVMQGGFFPAGVNGNIRASAAN